MDFGDILDKWEKHNTGAAAKKKANHRFIDSLETPQEDTSVLNPIEAWLRVNGVTDKDEQRQRENPGQNRRRLRAKRPDADLDIHGLNSDEAWEALERFFETAVKNEFEKVLVIHGKGNHSKGDAVLGDIVRRFIEHCPAAGESGHEKAINGGSGATWVLVKKVSPP